MTTTKRLGSKWTPEMVARIAAVREAMCKLRDCHYAWMIESTTAHFAKSIRKLEEENMRYAQFTDLPVYSRYGRDRERSRAKTIERNKNDLEQYYAILEFLDALQRAQSLFGAEKFAEEVRAAGFGIGGDP